MGDCNIRLQLGGKAKVLRHLDIPCFWLPKLGEVLQKLQQRSLHSGHFGLVSHKRPTQACRTGACGEMNVPGWDDDKGLPTGRDPIAGSAKETAVASVLRERWMSPTVMRITLARFSAKGWPDARSDRRPQNAIAPSMITCACISP